MKPKSFLFLILFLITLAGTVIAQDVVVLNNGRKILCRITSIDSASIFYKLPHQTREFSIQKREVKRYDQNSIKPKTNGTVNDIVGTNELFILSFMAGPASPIQDFGSMDINNEKSGLAKTGNFLQASATIKLTEYFGLSVLFRNQKHAFAHELLAQALTNQYRGNPSFTSFGDNWKIRGFFAGVYLMLPVKTTPQLSLNFHLLGGLPKIELPEYSLRANSYPQSITGTTYKSTSSAGAIIGGFGLKYKVQKNVALDIGLSYFYSEVSFLNVYTSFSNGYYYYGNFKQKINTLNLQVGISFLMYPKATIKP